MHQFQGMSCFKSFQTYACRDLYDNIERNRKKRTESFHHHPIVTRISDLCNADLTRRRKRSIQGIIRASNVHPINEIGGDIDDETTGTDVSIITIK